MKKVNLHDSRKKEQEYDALIKIANITGLPIENFALGERPDIQNFIDSIGIEVTNVMTKEEGITNNIISKAFGHQYQSREELVDFAETIDKKFNGNANVIDGYACISSTKELEDPSEILNRILKATLHKDKLLKTYKHFKFNWLYLYFPKSIFSDEEIISSGGSVLYQTDFDSLFIQTIDSIYRINKRGLVYDIRNIQYFK